VFNKVFHLLLVAKTKESLDEDLLTMLSQVIIHS